MAGFKPWSSGVGSNDSAHCATITALMVFLLMGHPRPLFRLFSVFSNKDQYNFTTNKCEKMSMQYTALEFKPMTFRTVSLLP